MAANCIACNHRDVICSHVLNWIDVEFVHCGIKQLWLPEVYHDLEPDLEESRVF